MSNGPSDRYQPDTVVKKSHNWWATVEIALALVAVVAVIIWGAAGSGIEIGEGIDNAAAEQAAIEHINDARQQQGLPAVSHNKGVSQRARAYSGEMATAGSLEHGTVACQPSGENIGQTHWRQQVQTDSGVVTYTTSEELGEGIAQQWLTSPGHRKNIMSPRFSSVGVGIVEEGGTVWATQRFCG